MNIDAAALSFLLTLVRSVFLSVTLTALSGWTDTHSARLLLLHFLLPPENLFFLSLLPSYLFLGGV